MAVDPGHAESADVGFHDYQGTGSFFTSYSCDPENTEENLRRIGKIAHAAPRRVPGPRDGYAIRLTFTR